MIEALGAFALSIIVFAVGYGRAIERINNLQDRLSDDERHNEANISGIRSDLKVVTDLRVDLAEIKKDIHYIKERFKNEDQ
jgi:divalent metal cation (Fe/Co/Zn/Cd) transporter